MPFGAAAIWRTQVEKDNERKLDYE
jgi:hypothetical protein